MSLSNLPPELHLKIVQLVSDSIGEDQYSLRRQGLQLSLISRQWREIGTRMSWERFELINEPDDLENDIKHAEDHPELHRYVRHVGIDIDDYREPVRTYALFGEEEFDPHESAVPLLERFCNLETLSLVFSNLYSASSFLGPFRDAAEIGDTVFPHLQSFTFLLDDSENRPDIDKAAPCTTLLNVLPTLRTLDYLQLGICTRSDAELFELVPFDAPPLPALETLSIDFPLYPEEDSDLTLNALGSDLEEDEEEFGIQSESVLVYLLALPSATRLRSLFLSATSLTSRSLSMIETFTSLASLTLRLEPDNIVKIFDSLPRLLDTLYQLESLYIDSNHTVEKRRYIDLNRPQLECFLTSLPPSLVHLETHFDLSDGFDYTIDLFLDSRLDSKLNSWEYYDRSVERKSLNERIPSIWEFVLKKMVKVADSETGQKSWKEDFANYWLSSDLKRR